MDPEPEGLEALAASIVSTFSGLTEYIPAVVVGAIGVALFFWGVPKLIGLFKRVAS